MYRVLRSQEKSVLSLMLTVICHQHIQAHERLLKLARPHSLYSA